MLHKNKVDMHMHSDNSPDGHNSVTEMCERAVELGLRAVAVTDHCDCDGFDKEQCAVRLQQSFFEVSKAAHAFSGQLITLRGVELGQPLANPTAADFTLRRYPYDFVLLALHGLPEEPDYYNLDYNNPKYAPELCLPPYFALLLQMVREQDFDSLAHITYPFRYIMGRSGIALDPAPFLPAIDEILASLAARGKALEVNTAGMRQELRDFTPAFDIVRRFRELGGRYVTVGSDAHRVGDLGAYLDEALDMVAAAGFVSTVIYQGREPVEIPIEAG